MDVADPVPPDEDGEVVRVSTAGSPPPFGTIVRLIRTLA
jgi:hypothetical protein